MSQLTKVALRGEYFELYKLLKFENIAESGAQAKALIDNGEVLVNGEPESRRRRKLLVGDRIECLGEHLLIIQ